MIQYKIHPYNLSFIRPGGTSRGVMTNKKSWIIELHDTETNKTGWGECSIIENLSPDYIDDISYQNKIEHSLNLYISNNLLIKELDNLPSIKFGIETAFKSIASNNPFLLFNNTFSQGKSGININGLIWMGDIDFMKEQIETKLKTGFNCLKLKIGASNFTEELILLKNLRKSYPVDILEIRVDANGAFSFEEAPFILEQLASLQIHSIEQPIKAGNWMAMEKICSSSPLSIALDEELIGINNVTGRIDLLKAIKPQYIILKPSLIGGFSGTDEWISLAEENNISWWITSALESNIGLNAIAQYTASKNTRVPQGLGTGSLYDNNFPSPLDVIGSKLHYISEKKWDLDQLK